MRVDTMRRIDHWAGVPLCFLLTLTLRLANLFRRPALRPAKRVLLIELSEMGSAILVDPAMRKLQREGGAELFFLIFAGNKASLDLLGTVPAANIFTIREGNLWVLSLDTLRFLLWTRRRGIDSVIDLELFSRFTALLTGLSGAANRVGFHAFFNEGLYRGDLLTRQVAYNPHQHIAKNFIALVNALLAEKPELPYSKTLVDNEEIALQQVQVGSEELAAVEERIEELASLYRRGHTRVVLINPNASEMLIQRRWPAGRYAELMRRILADFQDVVILITGAPGEREEAEQLKTAVGHERCINFAGAVRFAQLPALYTLSTLMVTNDSGPAHFAAITPLPTFVLFGPETPALYGSLGNTTPIFAGLACSPCVSAANHRKTPCRDNICLQVITPERVFDAIVPVLSS